MGEEKNKNNTKDKSGKNADRSKEGKNNKMKKKVVREGRKIKQEKIDAKSAPKAKKGKKQIPKANVYIKSSYNNLIVTFTDLSGNTICSSSSGIVGYTGSRKSTAFAATKAGEDAYRKAERYGVREATVYITGAGMGRQAAVKGLKSAGLKITLLSDITPVPHNGCRPKRQPRGS